MAKRGQRSPYRVRFAWANGVTGTQVLGSRDAVLTSLDAFQTSANHVDTAVTVTVTRVAEDGTHTVLGTRTITPKEN